MWGKRLHPNRRPRLSRRRLPNLPPHLPLSPLHRTHNLVAHPLNHAYARRSPRPRRQENRTPPLLPTRILPRGGSSTATGSGEGTRGLGLVSQHHVQGCHEELVASPRRGDQYGMVGVYNFRADLWRLSDVRLHSQDVDGQTIYRFSHVCALPPPSPPPSPLSPLPPLSPLSHLLSKTNLTSNIKRRAEYWTSNGVYNYWVPATSLSLAVLTVGLLYIVEEYCTQSHLSTQDYSCAMQGLRGVRRYKKFTRWVRSAFGSGVVGGGKWLWWKVSGGRSMRGRRSLVWKVEQGRRRVFIAAG